MRAREFVSEAKGSMDKVAANATKGAVRFRDRDGIDRVYNLNQVMKAAGMADGRTTAPVSMDHESFAGKNNMAYPYTEEEHKMMKSAFATVGDTQSIELVRDHRSLEADDTQKKSPSLGRPKLKFK